jgi:hypothetical protein
MTDFYSRWSFYAGGPEYGCDDCGQETPDGHGSYENGRRVCAECAADRPYPTDDEPFDADWPDDDEPVRVNAFGQRLRDDAEWLPGDHYE